MKSGEAYLPIVLKAMSQLFRAYSRSLKIYTEHLPQSFSIEEVRVKRYCNDGIDAFDTHVDVGDHNSARRFLVCFLYLNDVEEGGTTDFPKIEHTITPKCARILVFPPNWMYRHAGRPVTKGVKYILGSYLHYM